MRKPGRVLSLGFILFLCLIGLIIILPLSPQKFITVETYTYFVRSPSMDLDQFLNYITEYAFTVSDGYDKTSIQYYVDATKGIQKAVIHTEARVKDQRKKQCLNK